MIYSVCNFFNKCSLHNSSPSSFSKTSHGAIWVEKAVYMWELEKGQGTKIPVHLKMHYKFHIFYFPYSLKPYLTLVLRKIFYICIVYVPVISLLPLSSKIHPSLLLCNNGLEPFKFLLCNRHDIMSAEGAGGAQQREGCFPPGSGVPLFLFLSLLSPAG